VVCFFALLVFLVFLVFHGAMSKMLLKTGDVATMLGVSRQHVVDLCDTNDLSCIWVGKHRRVPREAVEALLGSSSLTREKERSLWLHRALLGPLLADPEVVLNKARENLRRWKREHRPDGMTVRYLMEWEKVLNSGLDNVVETMISTTPEANELRQNSPFAGVLADETRVRVLKSFNDHWKREHTSRDNPSAA